MPPALMFHGDSDQLVSHTQSERMLAALQRAGVDALLISVGNADHDFAPFAREKPLSISDAEIQASRLRSSGSGCCPQLPGNTPLFGRPWSEPEQIPLEIGFSANW
jgi:hypothetical protein